MCIHDRKDNMSLRAGLDRSVDCRCLSCTWTCLNFKGFCCTWTCLHHRGPSCTWTCLDKMIQCWPWTCLVSTPQGPELQPDVSGQQEPVLVWTCYPTGAWTTPGRVWTTGVCTGLDMSTPLGPELHLDLSSLHYRGLCCTWTYLLHRGLCCTWMSTLQTPLLHLDVSVQQKPWSVSLWRYRKFCTWK